MHQKNINPKLRIAILADFPWDYFDKGAQGRGGGQGATWLAQLAEEFCKVEEFEFHWVTLDRSRWFGTVDSLEWCGQYFYRIPAGKASIDLHLNYLPSIFLLRRALARIEPQLLHVWGTERSYPIMGGWKRIPTVLSMQGILTEYQRIGSFEGDRFWSKLTSWEAKFLRAADVVTVESQWGIDMTTKVVKDLDIRQVEYGVHPSFYDVQWAPDEQNPYAIYSGSVDSRKGVDILLDAMEKLSGRGWKLKIAGDGPLRNELEKRNVPGVEWLGLLKWDELQRQLSHALCLVLPTRADTSPNVSKEARVIGLPVVTTQHGGQAGYIQDGGNGVIVEPLDSDHLAVALDRIMRDPEAARSMGSYRHENDRAYFHPAETAGRFVDIYREITGRNRSL
jgi:glycosyltransferase involved in cell wall biosynthesis